MISPQHKPKDILRQGLEELRLLGVPVPGANPVLLSELFGVRPDIREKIEKPNRPNGKAFSVPAELRECEPRFFVPLKVLLDWQRSHRSEITRKLVSQAYFEKEDWGRFLVAVPELQAYRALFQHFPVSQIRVRCTQENGTQSYELSVKAKFDPELPEYKIDVPVPFSAERFLALAAFADAGVVQKMRFVIPGQVYASGNAIGSKDLEVSAEADVLLTAGNPPQRLRRSAPRFALVEVDVKDPKWLGPLRNGEHSFSFLKPEMDLHLRGDELRAPLRMATLAKNGFGREAEDVVRRLNDEYKCLPSSP